MLQKFLDEEKSKNRAKHTLKGLVFNLTDSETTIGKPLHDAEWEDLLALIKHLRNEHHYKQGALNLRLAKLCQFYGWCFDETDNGKYHKFIKKLREFQKTVKSDIRPEDLLTPEDIKKLINVATLERDRCLVSVLFESGMRIGELLALTMNDIHLNEVRQEVLFNIPDIEGSKTGYRPVQCLQVYGYVQDWLKCNPMNQFMPGSYGNTVKIMDRLYKKAGIKKPSNPHMLRHSAITYAVNIGMQPNAISMRFWGIPNSNMLSVYVHLSEQMQSDAYRKAMGMSDDSATTIINPIASKCVQCGRLIQAGDLCVTCKENQELKITVAKFSNNLDTVSSENNEMRQQIDTQSQINDQLQKQMKGMQDFMQNLIAKLPPEVVKNIKTE